MPPADTWDRATQAPAPSDRAGRRGFDGQRCLDLGLTLLALPLALPLIGLAALAVKLDSPGPAFFRQQRLGQAGRPFELVKLRTMRAESDPSLHRAHVRALLRSDAAPGTWRRLSADPRVTRVGAWLRATGIDELPQLGNVLRGEMSLVGPRPALPYEAELWQDWHRERLALRPGITGLWQVEGRDRVDFDGMVRMDLDYIRRRSIGLDLSLIARTPASLVTRRHPARTELR